MAVRSVVLVTIALFVGIAAFVLHLLALCSPRWKITTRDIDPRMGPVSYGLWQRCESVNMTIIKQGVALGLRPNVQACRPNRYMRYSAAHFPTCYQIRRSCPVLEVDQLPEGCSCRYLPSTKGSQWLTILAAIFILLGLILLYLRVISSAENDSANFLLNSGPIICFLLALILMITGLIVFLSYFRRDTYEDYSFPLRAISNDTQIPQTFDLQSLRVYSQLYQSSFSRERYAAAVDELRSDANSHYRTVLGRASIYEIIATVLVLIVTLLVFLIGARSRSDEV